MNIKEAIEELENGEFWDKCVVPCVDSNRPAMRFHDALDMTIAALRAQQEGGKVDRSRWEGCPFCWHELSRAKRVCAYTEMGSCEVPVRFCPSCGRPPHRGSLGGAGAEDS